MFCESNINVRCKVSHFNSTPYVVLTITEERHIFILKVLLSNNTKHLHLTFYRYTTHWDTMSILNCVYDKESDQSNLWIHLSFKTVLKARYDCFFNPYSFMCLCIGERKSLHNSCSYVVNSNCQINETKLTEEKTNNLLGQFSGWSHHITEWLSFDKFTF